MYRFAISRPTGKVLLDVPRLMKYYWLLFCGFSEMKKIFTQKFGLLFVDSDSLLIPLFIKLSEFNADEKQQSHSIQKDRAQTWYCMLFL